MLSVNITCKGRLNEKLRQYDISPTETKEYPSGIVKLKKILLGHMKDFSRIQDFSIS